MNKASVAGLLQRKIFERETEYTNCDNTNSADAHILNCCELLTEQAHFKEECRNNQILRRCEYLSLSGSILRRCLPYNQLPKNRRRHLCSTVSWRILIRRSAATTRQLPRNRIRGGTSVAQGRKLATLELESNQTTSLEQEDTRNVVSQIGQQLNSKTTVKIWNKISLQCWL